MYATIPVFAAILIIIVPIFTCAAPEVFEHNVNKEFAADAMFEQKLRIENQMKEFTELMKLKHDQSGNITINKGPDQHPNRSTDQNEQASAERDDKTLIP